MDERSKAEMATSRAGSDSNINPSAAQEEAENLSWGSSSDTMTQYAPIRTSTGQPLSRRQTRNSISDNHELMNLARTASSGWEGPSTDPTKPEFDMNKWLRRTLNTFDEEGIRAKKAGIHFEDLTVSGSGAALQLQSTLGSLATTPLRLGELIHSNKEHKQIIKNFNGSLKSGELMIVLGRPGSGCSTFLKTLCGELHGLNLESKSNIHYNGIPQKQMMKEFKGEVAYNQEVDKHFPHLTVGETLEFAASARLPNRGFPGVSRAQLAKHMSQVVMAIFGLSHTNNTKVGNDFVRGVSGGERKRVSIAEMALSAAPLAAWDNSTRGLDSASALKFVEAIRLNADLTGSGHAVAIYQASQAIYDIFDKAIVLYEGKQIYFGPTSQAKKYFEDMGWFCPARQTTGDFLTSVTNPSERQAREGMEKAVPRTAEEFEQRWLQSEMYTQLKQDLSREQEQFSNNQDLVNEFRDQKKLAQTKHARAKSPYILSVPQQITLNLKRSYQRIWNDKSSTIANIFGQIVMSLIIGSVFYGTPDATQGFQSKGAVLFFAVLLNALSAINEINSLYAQRPIVEKQAAYAYYHPFTEALAGFISDIPIKFIIAVVFNLILYFLANLRREPSQFFIYFLIVFMGTLVMSAIFRTMGAITKTISQAMSLAGVLILALVVYTGFVVPVPYMKVWFSWIRYINPVFYAFEILIANEFHGREFTCSGFVPAYPNLQGDQFVCSIAGAVAGRRTVNGDSYIAANYEYYYSHVWRNFGILLAFLFGFLFLYVVATELNSASGSAAEFLVFRRGHAPANLTKGNDEESSASDVPSKEGAEAEGTVNVIPPQHDIFTWKDVCYDVKIKTETRRLLDNVAGYVKPGTLTALMGTSGAGKTTLLDVLAQRKTTGIITGDMLVNGNPLDASFQRKTGYVQQQDLHLETATVRESLRFSALLRQPKSVSQQEKFDYVEDVIKMLNMEDFAEAVVGVPGEGLNVEQRKLLTIGVELAAKPKLLLFLDEPTSGLDSQSAWAICAFLRKLADNGQAVLCTIHQPSAILFQTFDRLLFLAKGGKTVYFGNIGKNSRTMLDYFEANGGRHCDDEENPAEYMLEIVNHTKGREDMDWPTLWNQSEQAQTVVREIEDIHREKEGVQGESDDTGHSEFAMPFSSQLYWVTLRTFQQYWRTPSYILAKWVLGIAAGLFIGFSFFQADSSTQGLQNIIFSVFMVCTIFSTLVQQIMPLFVTQRELYEVREKPSKAYSWKAFMFANIVVEIPYNIIMGILVFACYYYAVTGIQDSQSQVLVLLLCIQFFIYAGTFAHLCIAAMPDAQTASTIVTLIFSLSLTFNGVMQSPTALPGFWIFMYRVSPFTYWVAAMVSPQVHGRPIVCSQTELSIFNPPTGETCQRYLASFLASAPGYLQNPTATSNCAYCQLSVGDQFLAGANIYYSERWRNFGIFWAYIFFNVFAATVLYYGFRVQQWNIASIPKSIGGLFHKFSKPKPMAKDRAGHKEMTTAHPY